MEIAEHVPVKANDLFLRIWKNIGLMVSLEIAKQIVLTIVDNDEEKAQAPKKRDSSQKGEGKGVKTSRWLLFVPPNIKNKGNPYTELVP